MLRLLYDYEPCGEEDVPVVVAIYHVPDAIWSDLMAKWEAFTLHPGERPKRPFYCMENIEAITKWQGLNNLHNQRVMARNRRMLSLREEYGVSEDGELFMKWLEEQGIKPVSFTEIKVF